MCVVFMIVCGFLWCVLCVRCVLLCWFVVLLCDCVCVVVLCFEVCCVVCCVVLLSCVDCVVLLCCVLCWCDVLRLWCTFGVFVLVVF